MDEGQSEQKQGFFSKAINGANSGFNNYRNARMATNAGKQFGKQIGKKMLMQGGRAAATEGTVALFSNPVGWVILGIGFVIVIIVVILFGGASGVKGGEPTVSPSPTVSSTPGPSSPSGAPVNASNVVSRLKSDFNMVVNDTNSDHLIMVYNILALAGKSSAYEALLKKAGPTQIYFDSKPCGGRVDWTGNITLHSFFSGCGQLVTRQYVLIHETGHVIAIYSGRLWASFYNLAYYPSDASCYAYHGSDGYYLKTYPYSAGAGGGGRAESFAEALSLYVIPRGVLSNYKRQCPVGYNWEKNNIFGGYEF